MFDKKQIEKNINWLLTNGSPPVAYLTHRDLLDTDPGSREMKDLWEKVKNQDEVSHIFSRQQTDGSWCTSGPWAAPASYLPQSGYTPVSPKYVTTAWILPILGDMGFTAEDIRIKRACDYILSYQEESGFISEERDVTRYDPRFQNPCRFSVTLIALGKAGAGNDPRVKKACDLLVKWQRQDGGWAFSEHYIQRRWT
ncbi:MAG: hypothetical protein JW755_06265, partial [Candidatus Aminicenantes bacterium]|nr:hypothetical protein [Candidatus Aminicenantes bacterium]